MIKYKIQNNSKSSFVHMKPSKCGICCLWILQRLTYKQVQWMIRPASAHLGLSNPVGLCSPQLSNVLKKQLAASKARRPFLVHSPQSSSLPTTRAWLDTPHFHWLSHSFVYQHTEQLSLKGTTGLHPATPNTHTTTQHSAEEATQAPQHPWSTYPELVQCW